LILLEYEYHSTLFHLKITAIETASDDASSFNPQYIS
jgi:hypothetical protein